MRWPTTSLQLRLVTAFLLVSLPPMLFAAQLASQAVATAFEQNVESWLRQSSAYFVSNMREAQQEAAGVARFIVSDTEAIGRLIERGEPLSASIAELVKSIGYDLVAIYDADQRLVYMSRPANSIENLRLGTDHALARVRIDDQIYIMNFGVQTFAYRGKQYYLLIGIWLDEEYLGALSAVTDLELRLYYRETSSFREFYSSRAHDTVGVLLDDRITTAVLQSGAGHYDRRAEGGQYVGLYTALRSSDGEVLGIIFCGLRSYASLTSWFNRTNLFLIILLTGTVLAVLAGLIVSRRLTRPLRALVTGVQAITRGDYRQRVAATGQDEVAELAGAFNDMAERLARSQELETQLRRQQRLSALGEVAVGIAHEVRNPLGVIKTSAELVQKRGHLPNTDVRLLGYVVDEVRRIDQLIRDFLEFAKPRPPILRPLNPVQVVRRVASFCAPELDRTGVQVSLEDNADGVEIEADEDQLFQVFLNLFLNAIEVMPNGGHLTVGFDLDHSGLIIAVRDTGSGIPPEVQEKIFNPFFTTKEHGNGLGLAKVFSIMESHGGRVECASQPGTGATFTLFFPLRTRADTDVAYHSAGR